MNTPSFTLLSKILDLVGQSGLNQIEACCALQAAQAMLPDLFRSSYHTSARLEKSTEEAEPAVKGHLK